MKFFSFFLPLWYPFSIHKLKENEICKQEFFSKSYIMYKDFNDSIIIHSDVCPHQGGRFSNNGFLNKDKNIVCPYHGFCYENGSFVGICHQEKTKSKKKDLKTFDALQTNDLIFINYNNSKTNIFYPPEENNSEFRGVSGFLILENNYLTVTENLLDMLHISFVHSFGSKISIPQDIQFEKISNIHGKTSFGYIPSKKTIGSFINSNTKNYSVFVENEFILPTNTITRVYVGESVKTVFTRSIPIDDNKTLLYWKLYRNFWTENFLSKWVGDFLVNYLMNQVLEEDINILKNINVKDRFGSIKTEYDITILKFRQFTKNFIKDLYI